MTVPLAVAPTLETHVAIARPQYREPVRLEQHTAGRPRRRIGGQLRRHEPECPPGKRAARRPAGSGERVERRVVEIEVEELRPHCCLVIQSREPAREMKITAPRSLLAEAREPDLPQLDVRRLG